MSIEDEEKKTEIPILSSFAVAAIDSSLLVVELESKADEPVGFPGRKVQFALTIDGAQQLADALVHTLRTMETGRVDGQTH